MNTVLAELRIDKWLWFARLTKTRALAQALCEGGRISRNGTKIGRASAMVRPGDVLVLPQGGAELTVRVQSIATRRGPAPEAQAHYEVVGRTQRLRHDQGAMPGALERPGAAEGWVWLALPAAAGSADNEEGEGRP